MCERGVHVLAVLVAVGCYVFAEHFLPTTFAVMPASPDLATNTMIAISYRDHSSSTDNLVLNRDYPQPLIKRNQVLVEVKFAAINPCDFKISRAAMPLWIANYLFPKCGAFFFFSPARDICTDHHG